LIAFPGKVEVKQKGSLLSSMLHPDRPRFKAVKVTGESGVARNSPKASNSFCRPVDAQIRQPHDFGVVSAAVIRCCLAARIRSKY